MFQTDFPKDLVDLRDAPVDLHEVEYKIRNFYLALTLDESEAIVQCLDARGFLNDAINLTKRLVDIDENPYLTEFKNAYFWSIDNIGRANKKINVMEDENTNKLNVYIKYNDKSMSDGPLVRKYIRNLITMMNSLVYYPIKNALRAFKNFPKELDGKPVIKDGNLFAYLLFIEIRSASELIGSIAEEKIARSDKSSSQIIYESGAGNLDSNYKPTEQIPKVPKDIKLEEKKEEVVEEKLPWEDEDNFDKMNKERLIFESDDLEVREEIA